MLDNAFSEKFFLIYNLNLPLHSLTLPLIILEGSLQLRVFSCWEECSVLDQFNVMFSACGHGKVSNTVWSERLKVSTHWEPELNVPCCTKEGQIELISAGDIHHLWEKQSILILLPNYVWELKISFNNLAMMSENTYKFSSTFHPESVVPDLWKSPKFPPFPCCWVLIGLPHLWQVFRDIALCQPVAFKGSLSKMVWFCTLPPKHWKTRSRVCKTWPDAAGNCTVHLSYNPLLSNLIQKDSLPGSCCDSIATISALNSACIENLTHGRFHCCYQCPHSQCECLLKEGSISDSHSSYQHRGRIFTAVTKGREVLCYREQEHPAMLPAQCTRVWK